MSSNEHFHRIAAEMRALPAVNDRVRHLIDAIRHQLDIAHSNHEWDSVLGLSQLLGGNAEILAHAVGVDNGKTDSKSALEDTNQQVRRTRQA